MARARISTRIASVPKCLYASAPDSLKESGALMYFTTYGVLETTLRAAPVDSESVLALQGCAAQRSAAQKYVEPPHNRAELESSSFSGGENIRESQ